MSQDWLWDKAMEFVPFLYFINVGMGAVLAIFLLSQV
jgi:hypothetical protein